MVEQSRERILASLFDLPVAVACGEDDLGARSTGFEDEPWFARATSARQREFTRGRACASRVLHELGVPAQPVARGTEGEPIWPAGVVGSISHAEGLCVAVGALASAVGAIGVDVDVDRVESSAFARRICKEPELSAIRRLGAPVEALAPVVFSAKEASYKLQFPLTRDASAWGRIEVLLSADTFTVRFDGIEGLAGRGLLRGRWRRALGFVWAGITLAVVNSSASH
jgi:4'-phosphopantetheinyl transferase EntD